MDDISMNEEHMNAARIKVNKKIGIPEWERFEQLADEKEELWKIFWAISNDKKNIVQDNICAISYFNRFVMPSLESPMREFITEQILDKSDIETILSLYVGLIPRNVCKTCDCEEKFINKLHKHHELDQI